MEAESVHVHYVPVKTDVEMIPRSDPVAYLTSSNNNNIKRKHHTSKLTSTMSEKPVLHYEPLLEQGHH